MRKILLFSVIILSSFVVNAGDKNRPVDLKGNWKETQRMSKDKQPIAYTDTIRIDFQEGNEFLWQKAGSYMFKGTYKATASSLDLGSRYFTIVQYTSQRILMQDDDGFYQISRYTKAAVAENNAAAQSGNRSAVETSGTIDMTAFTGTWEAYKRTSKVQQQAIDYNRIVKRIDLKVNGKNVQGSLHAAQEMNGKAGWNLDKYENGVLYFNGKDARQLKVLKCSGNELILEESDYTYFLKKFS